MKEKSKTNKLFSGLSVQTVITAIQGILEISLFAIMSRLLSKADFGYYAALMGIMTVCLSLSEAGLGSAIIQKKNASEGHVNTAFTLSILLGLLFSMIIFIFAPQISIIVADKSLAMPMRIVSITLLLNSLNSIGNSILLKQLNFKRVGIISIVSYFVSGIIGVVLALKGFGLYSIVAYVVLYPLFVCLLLYSTSVKIPKLTINKNEVRSIVSFGGWLTAGVIVNNITHQLDKLLLSKWISVEALGSYNRPAGFVNNIASKINGIFDTVLFPILSDLQEDSCKIKDVFLRAINLLNSFSVILSALFFFNAELIITLFFGEKWIELVPILRIVSISVIFNVNGRLVDCFFRSLALVKIGCFLRFVSAVITLVCLYIGAQFDIFGVAVSLVLANILNILTKVIVLAKKIRCNLGDLLSSWSRAMIAVVPVAILGLIFMIWIPKNIFSEFVFVIIIFITILIEFIYFPQLIGREYYNRIHPVIIAQLTKYFSQKNIDVKNMDIKTFTPYRLLLSLSTHRLLDGMSDKLYLTLLYFFRMHKFIDWQSPKSYTEKLQWLKINDRKPLYNTLVDKLLVRAYVSEEIGEKYLIPLVGYYNSFSEIDFSTLPNEFALKCTHGSHCSVVCFDKNTFDIERNRKLFEEWYNHEYYWAYREWPYKNLKPKIICEQLLKGEDGSVPTDYKVFCFNGKARFIKLDLARYSNHQRVFYDLSWKKYELGWGKIADTNIPKPILLDKMIELSEKLAKQLPQARIDWYISNNNLYFGEITFFDAGGFEKFDDYNKDLKVGALLNINK